jgi:translation initiation factor 1
VADRESRPVYETAVGRLCPKCGHPAQACRCSSAEDEAAPEKVTAVLALEKKGRGGKTVTTVAGLPRNRRWVAELGLSLRRACGTGGTVAPGVVELQGDHRVRLRAILAARGIAVKG